MHEAAFFGPDAQRTMIDAALEAGSFQRFELLASGMARSHGHFVCAWEDDRAWTRMRDGLKQSLTRRLNEAVANRGLAAPGYWKDGAPWTDWFCEGASRKCVRDLEHLDHLRDKYLPDHPGWFYDRRTGFRPPTRASE